MNENELILKAQEGNEVAKEQLYLKYKPLIYKIANKYSCFGTELEDLKQIATMGLLNAIRLFDVTKNIKFMSYVYSAIINTISVERKKENTINIGFKVLKDIIEIKKAYANYGEVSIEELQNITKLSKERIEEAIKTDRYAKTISMFKTINEKDTTIGNTLKSNFTENDMLNKIIVKDLINNLNDREKTIIIKRYFEGKSLEEIGMVIGVSKERVRQLEQKILKNMKLTLQGKKVKYDVGNKRYDYKKNKLPELFNKGLTNKEIAKRVRFSLPTIYKYRKIYEEKGHIM